MSQRVVTLTSLHPCSLFQELSPPAGNTTDRNDVVVCGTANWTTGAVLGGGNLVYVGRASVVRSTVSVQAPGVRVQTDVSAYPDRLFVPALVLLSLPDVSPVPPLHSLNTLLPPPVSVTILPSPSLLPTSPILSPCERNHTNPHPHVPAPRSNSGRLH